MIIRNATILTITRGILKGDILIKNNIIKEVGSCLKKDSKVIDVEGKIVLPGFINTHCHSPMYFMKGMGKGMPVEEWLNKIIFPIESKLEPRDIYLGTKMSCLEMIKNGITCFADMYYETDQIIKAVKEMGIRCCPSWCLIGPKSDGSTNVKKVTSFLSRAEKSELIRPDVSVHAPYTCSTEILMTAKNLADKKGSRLHIHVSENKKEVQDMLKKKKVRPIEYLESIGFLSSKVVLAHAVHLSDKEIRIIAEHNAKISHCPASNEFLSSGTIRLKEILDAGIVISLGTDSIASNSCLSIIHEMKKAREIQQWKVPAEVLVRMATINGAIALGLENELGSIEKGKKADIIVLDREGLWEDVLEAEIDTVMCNGKIIMEGGKLNLDDENIINEFNCAKKSLMKRCSLNR